MRLLTDWIDGRVKPTVPGVYQRKYAGLPAFSSFCRWNGYAWFGSAPLEPASRVRYESSEQRLSWRGLAFDPLLFPDEARSALDAARQDAVAEGV